MIKISVNGRVPDFSGKLEKAVREIAKDLESEVKKNTPVDTGYAKSRWKRRSTRSKHTINNDADYIQYLEEGKSKQAPKGMIEPAVKKIKSNWDKGKYI